MVPLWAGRGQSIDYLGESSLRVLHLKHSGPITADKLADMEGRVP